ncbi:MAG: hypothetical protein IJO71_09490 [Microbacterium sp.]|uniref:hypothetical protein n=1 Tax=Microbacterium sp. TaxID=51671 RepID=UPI0025EFC469|nr:hypothetical protein [Microbacterium sp.]MBQ9917414.1 hypothetical protein [Microbacterium sp.]
MSNAGLPSPDLPPAEEDPSLPAPSKPLVKAVKGEGGTYVYEVIHEGIRAIIGPWRDAYEHARGIAHIQAMVLDAFRGVLRG